GMFKATYTREKYRGKRRWSKVEFKVINHVKYENKNELVRMLTVGSFCRSGFCPVATRRIHSGHYAAFRENCIHARYYRFYTILSCAGCRCNTVCHDQCPPRRT